MPLFTDFPPDDLREALVDLYFRNLNDGLPLLHERMFKEAVASGFHLRDSGFGAIVLLVCANGARSSSDPRVLEDPSDDRKSSGWKWFKEVQTKRKLLLASAQLYDLQIYVVRSTAPLSIFMNRCSSCDTRSSCLLSFKARAPLTQHGRS